MSNEIKRAWFEDGMVRVHASDRHGLSLGMKIEEANELRDQLTQAIQEAEADNPFERWWKDVGHRTSMAGKGQARMVWDAARKESGK